MPPLVIPPELLRPATVLLSSGSGIGPFAIRLVTGPRWLVPGKWSHVALVEGAIHGDEQWTIEARGDGVKHRRISEYYDDPTCRGLALYDLPGLTISQRWAVCEWCDRHNGADYDDPQLMGIYLRLRLPFLRRFQSWQDHDDRYICSELVGRGFSNADVNICPSGVSLSDLAPSHFPQTMTKVLEIWRD